MLLKPSVHKVDQKIGPEEQMDNVEWNGPVTIGGVCEVCSTQRGLSKDLYSYSTSGGGHSMNAFCHAAFTAS